ncbi:MAG TPA: response regulator transcription factor [Chloroflexota bacterium]|nr:response regulator transcription factor [Chloroflexota bacterium]
MHRTRALVVDDDQDLVALIRSLLGKSFDSRGAGSGQEALQILEDWPADLIVLDLVMTGLDGFAVCQQIRQQSTVPILVLSGRQADQDKVRALDLGADDYLTKPFSRDELLARVRALLRRARQATSAAPVLEDGRIRIDFARRLVVVDGQEVRLTPTEYGLLEQLATNPGKLMTHSILLQRVWGPEYRNELDYLRVFIRRLRRKIESDPSEPQYIVTEPRAGYRFRSPHRPLSCFVHSGQVIVNTPFTSPPLH